MIDGFIRLIDKERGIKCLVGLDEIDTMMGDKGLLFGVGFAVPMSI